MAPVMALFTDISRVSHYTKIVENAEDSAYFDETFEWPVARPIEAEEIIDIQIFNYNKYLSNKLVGTFRMILQELVEVGNIRISDSLLDASNVVMQTKITFELTYNAPDGSVGSWQTGGFERLTSDEYRRPLSEVSLNLVSLCFRCYILVNNKGGNYMEIKYLNINLISSKTLYSRKTFYFILFNFFLFYFILGGEKPAESRTLSTVVKMAMMKKQRPSNSSSLDDDNKTVTGENDPDSESNDLDARAAEVASMLAATAQQLTEDDNTSEHSGISKIHGTKKSRPLTANEDLMMKAQDFQVCVTIIEARQLAGLNMDPVVCVQVGDQKKYTSVKESTNCPYYNEYFVFDFHIPPVMLFDKIITLTVLHSRNFLRSGNIVGTFKLDVSTVYRSRGHQFYHKWAMLTDPEDINGGLKGYLKCDIAVPQKSDKDEDDVEANLLLPDGVPADRQRAKFYIKVYRADGLPKMNAGIVANVKKAFTGESKDLVDPYVEVSFAGHKGKTSVKKGSYEPAWNEQVVFTEMFPPLCRRIKVQLRDSDSVNDDIIGTHFIDLSAISNEGEKERCGAAGGVLPLWLFSGGHDDRQEAGREAHPLRVQHWQRRQRPGRLQPAQQRSPGHDSDDSDQGSVAEDSDEPSITMDTPKWKSTTPQRPVSRDRCYYHLPYYDDKPCIYVREMMEDHRRRMYNSNIIDKIADKLEDGLNEVHDKIAQEMPFPERRLRGVFEELGQGCSKFDQLSTLARTMKATVTKNNKEDKLKAGQQYLSKLRALAVELPGKKASGQSGWTIQTKLQVFFWLGLSKHKKDYLKGMPGGYEETKMLKSSVKPNCVPPSTIHYTSRQVFQMRAHMYQARQLIGSDASGLSDPYACVTFGDQSVSTQVIDETLSPTWDEMLIIKEMFCIFSKGKSEFIGRALCKPVVKLSTEEYKPPKFPPRLEWWDVYRGTDRAGELLATFELLQLAPFGVTTGEDLPPLELPTLEQDRGPIMPVLFWGVRDIKRVHLQQVDRPRIDIECAGHVLSSTIIQNCKKNPNFSVPVKYFDVELPENDLYCPPITIRCVDCRSFGRFTLVGTHVISKLHKFMYIPTTRQAKAALAKMFPIRGQSHCVAVCRYTAKSLQSEDVAITIDENLPLINRDTIITISASNWVSEKTMQTEENKRRKKGNVDEDEPDMDALDWWSKYFASVETMIREHGRGKDVFSVEALQAESKMTERENHVTSGQTGYGAIPNGGAAEGEFTHNKESSVQTHQETRRQEGKERSGREKTFKGTAKAVSLAKQLSPRAQRKKEKLLNSTAQLKVFPNELEKQEEFEDFTDWLHTFELYRGKNTGAEGDTDESRIVGKFKGSMRIYKIPLPPDIEDCTITGGDPNYGLFQGLPSNDPVKVLVRVYIVKANDLHPADINGKADPYLVIRLGSKVINDKENYISKQLNPVFGKIWVHCGGGIVAPLSPLRHCEAALNSLTSTPGAHAGEPFRCPAGDIPHGVVADGASVRLGPGGDGRPDRRDEGGSGEPLLQQTPRHLRPQPQVRNVSVTTAVVAALLAGVVEIMVMMAVAIPRRCLLCRNSTEPRSALHTPRSVCLGKERQTPASMREARC
ncbi:hypothetical protein C0Q70_17171 [Pomacea canaliculata]|uniref:C2 domain-containing protein n=1 Tax=Pomacea canaliculata TaxID=400727 RepID=A0A2T7NRW2_POMCA|nr:hypothetical protein C0Q70_17171 [Pomacea canaliculata]